MRGSVRPSVTFCFFNILKSHRWNFIKHFKHIHIYMANIIVPSTPTINPVLYLHNVDILNINMKEFGAKKEHNFDKLTAMRTYKQFLI